MAGKIFVNYRRDDERAMAARLRDRLAQAFGDANVFMDVDNLLAGQRFDKELEKALDQTDVFLAVIGPRWAELLAERQASGERDYVREEIVGALKRGIVVIPVLIERTPLPRADALPEDICDLVLHQKHVVTHEQFGRDVAGLVEAIRFGRKAAQAEAGGGGVAVRWVGGAGLAVLVLGGGVLAYQMGVPAWLWGEPKVKLVADAGKEHEDEPSRRKPVAEQLKSAADKLRKATAEGAKRLKDEIERQKQAKLKDKPAEEELLRPGRVFRDCPDCPEMVVVPAGEFKMGSPASEIGRDADEGPQRKVTIQRPFAVGKFEVTFAEWEACVAGGGCASNPSPSDSGGGKGRRPVINVSWYDAKEYVAWLSRKTEKAYRLLSEAEWEYAARAGSTTRYSFGDTITKSHARYSEGTWGSAGNTVEVGSFQANKFGLHDMHGNASEWCEDTWHTSYLGAPDDGSVWVGGTSLRVLRGGSWYVHPDMLRSAKRFREEPGGRYISSGLRLATTL